LQIHLNVGLRKISETVDQVEELRRELSTKNKELQYKNNLANEKLKQVVNDQQEAENKKKTSRQIRCTAARMSHFPMFYFKFLLSLPYLTRRKAYVQMLSSLIPLHVRTTADLFRVQLEELNTHIGKETNMVMDELSKVEPAVRDAKSAVRGIKKQHLVEIRSMANPPAGM